MRKTEKQYSGKAKISFYVEPEIKERIKAAAKANEQSVSELFKAVCDQLLGILPEEPPTFFSVEAKKNGYLQNYVESASAMSGQVELSRC